MNASSLESSNRIGDEENENFISGYQQKSVHKIRELPSQKRARTDEIRDENIADIPEDEIDQKIVHFAVDMNSHDKKRRLKATKRIRHILCTEAIPPIRECIKVGIIPVCIEFLQKTRKPELQFEAAWILTNITAGTSEQTNKVIELGAIDPLLELLNSDKGHLVTQSLWALTNLMGESTDVRDLLLDKEIVPLMAAIVRRFKSEVELMRIVSWSFSSAFRGKRTPIVIGNIFEAIAPVATLTRIRDVETAVCACWTLSSLLYIENYEEDSRSPFHERIFNAILDHGLLAKLLKFLDKGNEDFVYPCLRAIGNIVSGPDEQTEAILELGVLEPLCKALQSSRVNIVKEAAWVVSNICAGTVPQISAVVKSGAIPLLFNVIEKEAFRAKKEAIWAIANITIGGSESNRIALYKTGVIKCLCQALSVPDWNTLLVVFDALENMVKGAKNIGIAHLEAVLSQTTEFGGFDKIFQLQQHENKTVYKKAFGFIQEFYAEKAENSNNNSTSRKTKS